jgi:Uma2 family endonuclease
LSRAALGCIVIAMDARHAASAPPTTAPGERHRFTVDEVFAMQAAGLFDSGAYELIDGDLCVVAPKKNDHEILKRRLVRRLTAVLPVRIAVAVEASLFLSDRDAPEPDIMLHADTLLPEDVRGPDVALLIEIADESLARDLGRKAQLYATHGVQTYWVIEAATRRTHVHTGPMDDGGWRSVTIHDAGETLTGPDGFSVVLAAL